MTGSDDNDKTRIKGTSEGSLASDNNAGDDKTRIASPGLPKDTQSPQAQEDREKVEQARRLAAQKKARELEKRLAVMEANKNKAKATLSQGGPEQTSDSDSTVLKPSVNKPAQSDDHKTRIAQPKEQAQTPLEDESSDKTVFKGAPKSLTPPITHNDSSDKTLISEKGFVSKTIPPITVPPVTIPPVTARPGGSPDSSEAPDASDVLKGRFVYEKILGAGGMGVVYKARDLLKVEAQDRDPYVAIKVLGDEFKAHPEAFIALQRESRKTQRIAHPNIVNVYDFDRDGDTVFMTMEYMEGKPLDKLISQYKATGLPEEECWTILEGISAALIYAHKQDIIHSDFKPGNIFVTEKGVSKVFDFGIARAVAKAEKRDESVDDKTVFDAGNLGALTPAYASLEMLEGKIPDIRDDIYALGCIAYELFTGNHPFNRVHADEAMKQKLKPQRITNISKRQWKVIEKALAFKREDRVASVDEFWSLITAKRGNGAIIGVVAAIFIAAISFLGYQNYFAPKDPGFSAADIRSEVERDLLTKQNKREITELMQSKEFTESWENLVWEVFGELGILLGQEDLWLVEQKSFIANTYVSQVAVFIDDEDTQSARRILQNLPRYLDDEPVIANLMEKIEEAEQLIARKREQEKIQKRLVSKQKTQEAQEVKVQKEKNQAFDVALDTVNKQLLCRSTMSMRDVSVAIDKLRDLNSSRYQKEESNIIAKMATCISSVGQTFPERGEEFKKRALRIFPDSKVVANIKIEPKDPCDLSLAGLGARGPRALCSDPLKNDGNELGKGPALVVIPSKGGISGFAISKYEITLGEINEFCEASGNCKSISGDLKMPAVGIDLETVRSYLSWLSRASDRSYRFPTRAEWIYAAQADSSKVDSNRNCRLDSRGIKKGGVLIRASTGQQNAWGLVNYLGNAREIVSDRDGYSAMGGSFDTAIEECTVSKKESFSESGDSLTGFRVLRVIDKAL